MTDTTPRHPPRKDLARAFESIVLVIAVIASVVLASWVIGRCSRGFDFTDEGFYLGWLSNPWINKDSVTQFGYVYHPWYAITGGDIVLLRQLNVLLMLGLGWIMCFVLLSRIASKSQPTESWGNLPSAGIAFVLATSTLALFQLWVPTPSYNSLALQSLLVAGTGIQLADATPSRGSTVGCLLIGVAGWLALMAKPTTAVALGAVTGLYLVLAGKLTLRTLALPLATAAILVCFSAWIIDGSIGGFMSRLFVGAEDARALQGGHTLWEALRWDDIVLNQQEKCVLFVATSLTGLATFLSSSNRQIWRWGGATLGFIFSLYAIAVIVGGTTPRLLPTLYVGLLFWAAPLGVLLAVLAISYRNLPRLVPPDRMALTISFAAFPHVFAFGTGNSYWVQTPEAAVFWVLAGVVLLGSLSKTSPAWRMFLPVAIAAQLGTATILFLSMEYPYRQSQPLRKNEHTIQIAGTGAKLLVSRESAEYVAKLRQTAAASGFKIGEPMLDLTGHYPGALYAIGARLTGRQWMIGGYPGSDALAAATLDRVPREELKRSWILLEPAGPRRLSAEILRRYGIDLTKDYTDVGTVHTPPGEYSQSFEQHLLKPIP